MKLLFDVKPPHLNWALINDRQISQHHCDFSADWKNIVSGSITDKSITAIGYVLDHGGESIIWPVSLITPETLSKLEQSIAYYPEHNEMILKIVSYWIDKLTNIPHILLCNTAFFLDMPQEASMYAVPLSLRQKGIQRFGDYGLYHEWIWNEVQKMRNSKSRKVISVFLGNHSNIVAIKDGKPLETTIGFTSVEGIPSTQSCGDIDPSIIFELFAQGCSIQEVNQILSKKSGLSGLLGKKCSIVDIFQNRTDLQISEIREILFYTILKYIGAFASIMDGVDVLVFFTEYLNESLNFITDLNQRLDFLDIKWKDAYRLKDNHLILSKDDSKTKVFCLNLNKWKILGQTIENFKK